MHIYFIFCQTENDGYLQSSQNVAYLTDTMGIFINRIKVFRTFFDIT